MTKSRFILSWLLCLLLSSLLNAATEKRPNVILIITDDQGYGEISAHGHPYLETPHMDALHGESVRFTDFHVDPTCSPTRAALLTGRYSTRTGVWHTINGRSMMRGEELTMAEVFKANGYATAMIGKWHLGANYPFRPSDQGFEHTVWHMDGVIGGSPDYWENDYYDDHYMTNGEWKQYEGYCTDVWFEEATKFVEANREEPFFLYLSTNAPHGPYIVDERYSKPFMDRGMPENLAKFYGMIVNIDENLGKFREQLEAMGVAENTLLIFMTDNGTTAGWICQKSGYEYYNAGMRGWKSSAWEGGHRVPIFWHWPERGWNEGRDVTGLTAHIDILPTFVDILNLKKPEGPEIDGQSLGRLLKGEEDISFEDRSLFVHVQRSFLPPKWDDSVAMRGDWRLIEGQELYNLQNDPGQDNDVAEAHPEVVAQLRNDYEDWWASLQPAMERTVRHVLGGGENPMTLNSHDWLMPDETVAVWHQSHVRRGDLKNGPWAVEVAQDGIYEISLYRWAPYLEKAMEMKSARLRIDGFEVSKDVLNDATSARFLVKLNAGPTMLKTWLERPNGDESGAYYCDVRYVGPSK
ncbi:N-acetylgalactosamine 6-sulfate sulfatase [Coraliomargarita sinensis]|uniref:N-acetylgalactosamine 6-sulfate sulfatase n=1 Tax=Coraliomargarita sinensis TaxID=2174842 RepID=A0A317ZJT8_9BACT|nr:arylsulfatase [Coraliomargarita sinensis]PXA04049.1 N-acetylgalactosamine 6-sulfate sulfatase [Coraliomargarita sinensis]